MIPGWAHRERVVKSDLGDVNDRACGASRGNCDDGLEDISEVAGDVITAVLVWSEAEGTAALRRASRAVAPADRTDAIGAVLARRVAQARIVLLLRSAGQWRSCRSAIRVFGARDTNVCHATRAVRRADAAGHVVEIVAAFRVPQKAPLFAVVALMGGSSATTIRGRLVAEGSIVPKLTRAVLPADWTHTVVSIPTPRVAQRAILLLVSRAAGDRLADTAAVRFNPAALGISVGTSDWLQLLLCMSGEHNEAGCSE